MGIAKFRVRSPGRKIRCRKRMECRTQKSSNRVLGRDLGACLGGLSKTTVQHPRDFTVNFQIQAPAEPLSRSLTPPKIPKRQRNAPVLIELEPSQAGIGGVGVQRHCVRTSRRTRDPASHRPAIQLWRKLPHECRGWRLRWRLSQDKRNKQRTHFRRDICDLPKQTVSHLPLGMAKA